jgi:hypothetical protein
MRHWERTKLAILCGGCGQHLAKDTPIQVIELPGVKRKYFRGECCADTSVPNDVPPAISDRELLEKRVESIRGIARRIVAQGLGRQYLPHPDD